MATPNEVMIDGVIYVPVVTAGTSLDQMMQALYETYMVQGEHWSTWRNRLWVSVNEDGEGETLEEFAAQLARALGEVH